MSVIVLLIFASLAMATAFLVGFIWAVRSGQYEDTSTPSMRVLMEDCGKASLNRDMQTEPSLDLVLDHEVATETELHKKELDPSNVGVVAKQQSFLTDSR